VAGPADLGDDDRLARKGLLQAVELREGIVDSHIDGDTLPVGQQVHSDEVHMLGKLRMREPDMPGLCGAHRLSDRLPRAIEVPHHLPGRQFAAQDHFIADEHPRHVRVGARDLDGSLELPVVLVRVIVDPRAERDVDVMAGGELRDIGQSARDAVGTYRRGLARKQLQIGIDLRIRRHLVACRVFVRPEGRERKPLDARGPRRLGGRAIQECPCRERQRRERRRNQQSGQGFHSATHPQEAAHHTPQPERGRSCSARQLPGRIPVGAPRIGQAGCYARWGQY